MYGTWKDSFSEKDSFLKNYYFWEKTLFFVENPLEDSFFAEIP